VSVPGDRTFAGGLSHDRPRRKDSASSTTVGLRGEAPTHIAPHLFELKEKTYRSNRNSETTVRFAP
jgi:hypothetical protein